MSATAVAVRKARATPFLIDQYLPEFWERRLHPYLGAAGTLRYRFTNGTISSLAYLRLRFKYDTDTRFDTIVEDRFRLMNACMTLNEAPQQELLQAVTEPLAAELPIRPNRVPPQTPFFRVIRLVEKPSLMQSRLFYVPTPDKQEKIRFAQMTFRLLTEQSPVRNEKEYPVDAVGFEERKVWLPAARPRDGRIYYFDPTSTENRTYRPISERFSPMPILKRNRGTFGNSGRVLEISKDKKLYQVENYVVLERRVAEPETAWRIHHF
jgi:hypothetical protein